MRGAKQPIFIPGTSVQESPPTVILVQESCSPQRVGGRKPKSVVLRVLKEAKEDLPEVLLHLAHCDSGFRLGLLELVEGIHSPLTTPFRFENT